MARIAQHRRPAVIVPFEAPDLLGTRVRDDENNQRLALLFDFAGNGSTFVLPWRELSRSFSLRPFDGALHALVNALPLVTPARLADAISDVRASGAAGHTARAAELERRAREQARVERMGLVLTRYALERMGLRAEALSIGSLHRPELEQACLAHGMTPQRLGGDLHRLCDLIAPLGLAEIEDMAGPLRTLAGQMIAFVTHCRYRAGRVGTSAEAAFAYGFAAAVAEAAQGAADRIVGVVDTDLADLPATLAAWDRRSRVLATAMRQLQWVLDGWESVIALHAGVWDLPPNASVSKPEALKMLIEELPGRRLWSPQGAPSRAA